MRKPDPIRTLAALFAAVLAIGATGGPSLADDAPSWVVVTPERTTLRCGDQDIFYTIAEVKRGDVLASEGPSGDYTRVRYTRSMSAFLPEHEGERVGGTDRVRLVEDSPLRAASLLRGIEGSWSPVYTEPLPSGTELELVGVVRHDDGTVVGYRVRPPVRDGGAHPIAYIRTSDIRRASEDEVAAHLGAAPSRRADPEPQGDRDEPEPEPEPIPDPAPRDEPSPRPDPGAQPETAADPGPDPVVREDPGAGAEGAASPEVIENTAPPRPEKGVGFLTPTTLESLERAFERARRIGRDELDASLDELRAEFERALGASDDEDLSRALAQRLAWIELRIETRDQRRAIERTLTRAGQAQQELAARIQMWRDNRTYRLVGRLTASSVYTGDELPLLYRVRAPDPVTGIERTIGYVAPNDEQDLRPLLGSIVGVTGDPVRDDALGAHVIRADRVDRLGP